MWQHYYYLPLYFSVPEFFLFFRKSLKGTYSSIHCLDRMWQGWRISVRAFWKYFETKGPFECKLFVFLSCSRAYETWKQCQWIVSRGRLLVNTEIWGKFVIWLFLMSLKPGGNINERPISGLSSCLKKIIKRFLNYREICKREPNCIQQW